MQWDSVLIHDKINRKVYFIHNDLQVNDTWNA
jgi:hypothetical protein